MAMTKIERAHMLALQEELRMARAFRFTEAVEPDIERPKGDGRTAGWVFNAHNRRVGPACSGPVSHYIGAHEYPLHCGSRGAISLYSTRERALRGMRHELELRFARELAQVDAEIEKEVKA